MRTLLLIACATLAARELSAQFAGNVISYNPGTGASSGFNLPTSALGEPSRFTEHQFGGPVDPSNPPFLNSQIVSIGTGGSLTLQMAAPVANNSSNPYGLDFIVYGNTGFIIDFVSGKTDGTLFGGTAPGSTRISVSADNVQYFALDMSLAPAFDSYFPTDGSGVFGQPVNPTLGNASSFNDLTLAEIRNLYAGSGGGTGFDLAWARDGGGAAVGLSEINFIRFDVLSGAAEIDGIAAVPEPSTWALIGMGAVSLLIRKRRA